MKSLEVRFNEALAELKKKVSAKKYDEVCQEYMPLSGIEPKLNCVEEALKTVVKESSTLGLKEYDIDEVLDEHGILFGREPKKAKTTKESAAAPIVKHNGRADNFVENNPLRPVEEFRESADRNSQVMETSNKVDKATADGLLKCGSITEAEHAKLVGKKPAGYEQLSEQQRKDFDFARLIGINEADAFRVAKMAGTTTFKEVSR